MGGVGRVTARVERTVEHEPDDAVVCGDEVGGEVEVPQEDPEAGVDAEPDATEWGGLVLFALD